MLVETVVHPRDINLLFVAYTGICDRVNVVLELMVVIGGVILSDLVCMFYACIECNLTAGITDTAKYTPCL
jgi:hypothetical protein